MWVCAEGEGLMSPSVCPYCGFVAYSMQEEIDHMSSTHRAVVLERLRKAGLHKEANAFQREPRK